MSTSGTVSCSGELPNDKFDIDFDLTYDTTKEEEEEKRF